jgi:ubiquinone/menaquinone biosynthesis C-methylase UbiE
MPNTTDAHFAGSIPELYARHLVPLLFEPYAQDLAERLSDLTSGVVVEVAAGTGVVTRALAQALPPSVRIIATDLNEDMLRVASGHAAGARVTWQQADAQQLPFQDASADALVCQFGIMFVPDKLAAYREARRVLRPAGRYVFNVWDSLARNEVTELLSRTVAELFPQDPPRFIERTPFGYFDAVAIRQALEGAGFNDIAIESVEKVTRALSSEQVAVGMCQGTPLRGEIESRAAGRLDEVTATVIQALDARFGGGTFDNRMTALVVTASG